MLSKEIKNYINTNRRDFTNQPFSEEMALDNPIKQYEKWFDEALKSNILDPYAACLSTVDNLGRPSSRILYIETFLQKVLFFIQITILAKVQISTLINMLL